MAGTYSIEKIELKRMLSNLKVSDKNAESIISSLDKMHKHVNILVLIGMLQKFGLGQPDLVNMLRRIGIDDITISNLFDSLDEQSVRNTFGKLIELSVD